MPETRGMWSVLQYAMRYSHSDSIVHKRGTGMTGTGKRQDESRTAALGTSRSRERGATMRRPVNTECVRQRHGFRRVCNHDKAILPKTTTGAAGRADGQGSAACCLRLFTTYPRAAIIQRKAQRQENNHFPQSRKNHKKSLSLTIFIRLLLWSL